MRSDTKVFLQLKDIIDTGYRVTISEGPYSDYECTLYHGAANFQHSHFGGDTIAEAVNRTYQFYLTLKDK